MTKETYAEYKLIHYHDVWGNPVDDWYVNDQCDMTDKFGTITISDDASDEELIDYLIHIGYFPSKAKGNICVDGDDMMIEFSEDNGYPLCRLEKIRDIR
jgi:hypothetical protein